MVAWLRDSQCQEKKLSKIQRLDCFGIRGAMHTTPTNAVEALICLPLLELVVHSEAKSVAHRLWSLTYIPLEDTAVF